MVWKQRYIPLLGLLLGGLLTAAIEPASGHHNAQHKPALLRDVGLDQRLGETVALDAIFHDEAGKTVRLGDYFGARPVLLVLSYFQCPRLCPLVLDGLTRSLKTLAFSIGEQFQVITVSIDTRDTPEIATAKKFRYVQQYGRPAAADGWHFLTGGSSEIARLARSVGFRYTYDAQADQFVHAAGIMILTPKGKLARYVYGIDYAPQAVRLGLVEAGANTIGSPIDRLLLFCYHYDPSSGTYSLIIMNVVRLAGAVTILGVGALMGVLFYRERRKNAAMADAPASPPHLRD
jgi:protein SCO1/2